MQILKLSLESLLVRKIKTFQLDNSISPQTVSTFTLFARFSDLVVPGVLQLMFQFLDLRVELVNLLIFLLK